MREIEYPYIGKSKLECVVLFFSKGTGFCLESGVDENGYKKIHVDLNKTSSDWIEDNFKNITSEYLTSTWGVVESAEHAEFIRLLAINAGFEVGLWHSNYYFTIYNDVLWFEDDEREASFKCKQITIPMPPKSEVEKESSESKFPQIGDEVVYNGETYIVKLPKDKDGHIVVDRNGSWCNPHVEDVEKPKTPEQELRDELISAMDDSNTAFIYADEMAKYLLSRYTITPK